MKNNQTIWALFIFASILFAGSQATVCASPIFPPADNQPINQVAEKKDMPAEAPQQNTSTETANLHKDTAYSLAQINVNILFGVNEDGKKSYKTTYQLAQVSADQNAATKEPQVHVTYKKKVDKEKYTVEEVVVKKMANNAYQITAKIIESTPDKKITPKVTWVD